MSFAHWETNNDYSFVINLQEQIKNKYLTVFVIESKSLKCELRQLRKITRQESRNALVDQTEIVEHALYLSLDATNEIEQLISDEYEVISRAWGCQRTIMALKKIRKFIFLKEKTRRELQELKQMINSRCEWRKIDYQSYLMSLRYKQSSNKLKIINQLFLDVGLIVRPQRVLSISKQSTAE